MKLSYSIAQHCINKEIWDEINKQYSFYKLPYFIEQDEEVPSFKHYYMTKDCFLIQEDNFYDLLHKMEILNNQIIPKTVSYLIEYDKQNLIDYFKFSEKIAKVIEYDYKNKKQLNSYYWRYDLLIDTENNVKIIEFNSETPAWFGETLLSTTCIYNNVYDEQLNNTKDFNSLFEERVWNSLESILSTIKKWKTLWILYWSSDWEIHEYEEDYINALHICAFFIRRWIDAHMIFANDLTLCDEWLFHNTVKIDHIFTFYPLEWIFEDDTEWLFFDAYLQWKFSIINTTLNLISQNKRFWSYVYEKLFYTQDVFTFEEKEIIQELLPKSSISDFFWSISKAILFREWIWIYFDEQHKKEATWDVVYQEKIQQQEFQLNTFYSNKKFENYYWTWEWWKQKWYITLWIYFWKDQALWVYTRFSEKQVSDDSCYFLPVFLKK